jgi:hypothetical protein
MHASHPAHPLAVVTKRLTDDLNQRLSDIIVQLEKQEMHAKTIVSDAENSAARIIATANAATATMKEEVALWETEKEVIASTQTLQPRIKLDIGGVRHVTSAATLTRFSDSMLGAMFSGRHEMLLDEDGYIFIDRDGTHFRHILNFLRNPELFSIDLSLAHEQELRREVDYYGLSAYMFPFIPAQHETRKNEIGNTFLQQDVIISQTASGMWQFSTSTPSKDDIIKNAVVCRKCKGAYAKLPLSTPCVVKTLFRMSHYGTPPCTLPLPPDSNVLYVVLGFRNFLNSDRTLIDLTQPEPPVLCEICMIPTKT